MQQAMLACALALINEGEVAWIEDPGFHQARNVFAFVGAKIVPRPIDREGLVIGKCSRQNSPRLIFVTPSHQFPFGVTMSLKRRKALIEFAESRDGYILEDDYNSEFRFDGPPLPCLQGLDNAGRVDLCRHYEQDPLPIAASRFSGRTAKTCRHSRQGARCHGPALPSDRSSYPGAFHHRRIFPQPCETDPRTLCPATRILYRTIPKMAGRLFRSGSNAGRFAFHRLAAAQGRFTVLHACL